MEREKVYKLIDREREYQDNKWKEYGFHPRSDDKTPVAAWLIYLEKQISEAKEKIYYLDEPGALEHVRKIAALAVACMEYNETKSRP